MRHLCLLVAVIGLLLAATTAKKAGAADRARTGATDKKRDTRGRAAGVKRGSPEGVDVRAMITSKPRDNFYAYLENPWYIGVIPAPGPGHMTGLTVLAKHIYISSYDRAGPYIMEYNADTLESIRKIYVQIEGSEIFDATACALKNRIYVHDKNTVYIVQLPEGNVTSWDNFHCYGMHDVIAGLTVSTDGHVIVSCYYRPDIIEYAENGLMLREIHIKEMDDIEEYNHLKQAYLLSNGKFLVTNDVNVLLVDSDGKIIEQSQGAILFPSVMVVNEQTVVLCIDGSITHLTRLVVLTTDLRQQRGLIEGGHLERLFSPNQMALDSKSGRLYITDSVGSTVQIYRVLKKGNK